MERRLKEIERNLQELNSISNNNNSNTMRIGTDMPSSSNVSSSSAESAHVDFVRTTGTKLNKLWRRLTSQQVEKYEPNRRYKLCKADLEQLYEDAKLAVLRDFAQDEERLTVELLEKSSGAVDACSSSSKTIVVVPQLNLSFSTDAAATRSLPLGSYSSISSTLGEEEISERLLAKDMVLQRSFSDTQIAEVPFLRNLRLRNRNATTSQRDVVALEGRTVISAAQSMGHFGASSPATTLPSADTMNYVQSFKTQLESKSDAAVAVASSPAHQKESSSTSSNRLKTADISDKEASTIASIEPTCRASSMSCWVGKLTDSLEASAHSMLKIAVTANTDKPKHSSVDTSGTTLTEATPKPAPSCRSASEDSACEIAEKLETISVVVSQLSQSNSLDKSTNTTASEGIQTKTSINSNATVGDEPNASTAASYSCRFENISNDMQSVSGGTLIASSKTSASGSPSSILTKETTQNKSSKESTKTFTTTSTQSPAQQSKTFTSTSPSVLSQSEADNRLLDAYEKDFESSDSSDNSGIMNVSMPQFEFTIEASTLSPYDDDVDASDGHQDNEIKVADVTRQQMERSSVITNVKSADFKSSDRMSPEKQAQFPAPLPPPLASTSSASATNVQLMPDIINELEIRRCQQILLENEHLKQYEHVTAVPYMYVREIPNKPPPPYVPPAHGSPMTTIFPSEDRIKDITYRRTHELYCELLKTDYTSESGEKLPSVLAEKITNIYERIILDICREYLAEHQEVLTQGDPSNFHSQLAFFNPPDRLRCIQASIYKEVRRCLAMDKTLPKRTPIYSVYGQRAKRDHIGKIIIQEMYDEDEKWCNFQREESEVLELIVEEMIGNAVRQVAKAVLLEEGGTVLDDGIGVEEQGAQAAETIETMFSEVATEANVQHVGAAEVQVNEELEL